MKTKKEKQKKDMISLTQKCSESLKGWKLNLKSPTTPNSRGGGADWTLPPLQSLGKILYQKDGKRRGWERPEGWKVT